MERAFYTHSESVAMATELEELRKRCEEQERKIESLQNNLQYQKSLEVKHLRAQKENLLHEMRKFVINLEIEEFRDLADGVPEPFAKSLRQQCDQTAKTIERIFERAK